jgi:Ca2+-transporting ATPase
VGALIIVFIGSSIGEDTPLTAIQLLWVNLIMDALGALALATESPRAELL